MVEQLATYLLEVYGPEEALEFSVRAAADSRAQGKLAKAVEWELVVEELRDPKRIAKLLRDVERIVELPEHAAWCIGKNRSMLVLARSSAAEVRKPLTATWVTEL